MFREGPGRTSKVFNFIETDDTWASLKLATGKTNPNIIWVDT